MCTSLTHIIAVILKWNFPPDTTKTKIKNETYLLTIKLFVMSTMDVIAARNGSYENVQMEAKHNSMYNAIELRIIVIKTGNII